MQLPTRVLALDFETSGLSSQYDQITRIGAAIVNEGLTEAAFDSRIALKPKQKISIEALYANIGDEFRGTADQWKHVGKGLRTLFEGHEAKVAVQDFSIWLANNGGYDLPIIAYKASFDHGFYDSNIASFTTVMRPLHPVWIDVLALAKRVLNGKLKSYSLNSVLEVLGLPSRGQSAHNPAEDAALCGLVYETLRQRITN